MSHPRVLTVVSPFKGTLSSAEVARALEAGVRDAGAAPLLLPASDGGDGLLDALAGMLEHRSTYPVTGPLPGHRIVAPAGWLDPRTAVVESRLICGLSVLPVEQRNPARTTTRGVGELIGFLAAEGATTVYVGLGGSATMDGGLGCGRAWGWAPRDRDGAPLPEGGGALSRLNGLRAGTPPDVAVVGLTDVTSPLLGPEGAVRFARQKGADAAGARALAAGLERLVRQVPPAARTHAAAPGAGAAGGLGFGLLAFGGGRLTPGAAWVLDRAGWDDALAGADLVVVGEGRFDATSVAGKLTGTVLARAARAGVPAALLAPVADAVPAGVTLETGGGIWDAAQLRHRAEVAVRRALRLPAA